MRPIKRSLNAAFAAAVTDRFWRRADIEEGQNERLFATASGPSERLMPAVFV